VSDDKLSWDSSAWRSTAGADESFDAAHCERVLLHLDDPTLALRVP
jgi:hypothetical protein